MYDDYPEHALHQRVANKLGLVDDDVLLQLRTGMPMTQAMRVLWRNLVFWLYGPWKMSTQTVGVTSPVAEVKLGGFEAKIFCEVRHFKVTYKRWWIANRFAKLHCYSCRLEKMAECELRRSLEEAIHLPTYTVFMPTKKREEYVLLCCYLDTLIAKVAKADPQGRKEFTDTVINF